MIKLPKLRSFFKFTTSQSGFSPTIVLLILLLGIVGGTYLVQQRTNILPFAADNPNCSDGNFTSGGCMDVPLNAGIVVQMPKCDQSFVDYYNKTHNNSDAPATKAYNLPASLEGCNVHLLVRDGSPIKCGSDGCTCNWGTQPSMICKSTTNPNNSQDQAQIFTSTVAKCEGKKIVSRVFGTDTFQDSGTGTQSFVNCASRTSGSEGLATSNMVCRDEDGKVFCDGASSPDVRKTCQSYDLCPYSEGW